MPLTNEDWVQEINRMDLVELKRLQRFAPAGHCVFCDPELHKAFEARVKALGGFTPEVSKAVGW